MTPRGAPGLVESVVVTDFAASLGGIRGASAAWDRESE